jgi:hypothetical protein
VPDASLTSAAQRQLSRILPQSYPFGAFTRNYQGHHGAGVRRLHDAGRSGWWLSIGIIPLIGWLVFIMLSPPTANDTRIPYGPNPKLFRVSRRLTRSVRSVCAPNAGPTAG